MLMWARVVLRTAMINKINVTDGNKVSVLISPFTGLIISTSASISPTQLRVWCIYIRLGGDLFSLHETIKKIKPLPVTQLFIWHMRRSSSMSSSLCEW